MAIDKASVRTSAPASERYEVLADIIDNVLMATDPGENKTRQRLWIKWQFLYIIWWEGDRAIARQQRGGGPARGLMQMEPATYWDIIDRFVRNNPTRVALLADAADVSVDAMGFSLNRFFEVNSIYDPIRQRHVGKNTWPSSDPDAVQAMNWLTDVDSFAITFMRFYFLSFPSHRFPPQNPNDIQENPRDVPFKAEFSEGWATWWKRQFRGGPNETPEEERARLRREFELRAAEVDIIDESLKEPGEPGEPGEPAPLPDDEGGACFIATAAFGPRAPEVSLFRRYRDDRLRHSAAGRLFIRCYYRYSPPVARVIRTRPPLRRITRRLLRRLIGALYSQRH